MAIAFVKRVGQANPTGAATTAVVTVPAGGVALGNRAVVVYCSNNPDTDPNPSCADSKGNTYVLDHSTNTGIRLVAVFSAPMTSALVQNDTITVTATSVAAGRHAMDVLEFSGIEARDTSAAGQGSDASPTSGVTPTRTRADSVIVGVCGWSATTGDTMTAGASFSDAATVESTGGATTRSVAAEYWIVSVTGTNAATGTLTGSRGWSMLAVVYPAPAAPASTNATQWGQPATSRTTRAFTPRVRGDDLVENGHAVNTDPYTDTSEG